MIRSEGERDARPETFQALLESGKRPTFFTDLYDNPGAVLNGLGLRPVWEVISRRRAAGVFRRGQEAEGPVVELTLDGFQFHRDDVTADFTGSEAEIKGAGTIADLDRVVDRLKTFCPSLRPDNQSKYE
ncbi:MAG: hypothetical protein HQK55_05550 [Deltaproteobacteria bacterium]|nr:hypothetical protein [Deltaproteobacteria bacterium]